VYWDGGAVETAELAVDEGTVLLLPEFEVDGGVVGEGPEAVTIEIPLTT